MLVSYSYCQGASRSSMLPSGVAHFHPKITASEAFPALSGDHRSTQWNLNEWDINMIACSIQKVWNILDLKSFTRTKPTTPKNPKYRNQKPIVTDSTLLFITLNKNPSIYHLYLPQKQPSHRKKNTGRPAGIHLPSLSLSLHRASINDVSLRQTWGQST